MQNQQQKACVLDDAARVISCVAVPGSGKTKTLVDRIAHRVRHGMVHPSHVLAITFTRLAAVRLQEKLLLSGLQKSSVREMAIGTFHGVCYNFVRSRWRELGYASEAIAVYDRNSQVELIRSVISESRHTISQKSLLAVLGEMAATGMMPTDVDRKVGSVLRAYLVALKEQNAVDYSLIPYLCLGVLESSGSSPWREVYVDESQDLDDCQHKMISRLGAERMFFVGDFDQAIFGWRGADPAKTKEFLAGLDAKTMPLGVNYRSGKRIIEAANRLIAHNPDDGRTVIVPADGAVDGSVRIIPHENFLPHVREALSAGGGVAVLGRTHASLEPIASELVGAGIPVNIPGQRERFMENPVVKGAMAMLSWPDFPDSALIATRTMTMLRLPELEICGLIAKAREGGVKCLEYIAQECEAVADLYSDWSDDGLLDRVARVVATANTISGGFCQEDRVMLFRMVSEYIRAEPSPDQRSAVGFATWVNMRDAQDDAAGDGVRVLTMHAAKGLEFGSVFIVDVHDRNMPYHRAWSCPERMAEERRLMFVAMTRAERSLYLVEPGGDAWVPSRFMREAGLK